MPHSTSIYPASSPGTAMPLKSQFLPAEQKLPNYTDETTH